MSHLEEAFLCWDPVGGGDLLVCPNCLTVAERAAVDGDNTAFQDEVARSEEWHA